METIIEESLAEFLIPEIVEIVNEYTVEVYTVWRILEEDVPRSNRKYFRAKREARIWMKETLIKSIEENENQVFSDPDGKLSKLCKYFEWPCTGSYDSDQEETFEFEGGLTQEAKQNISILNKISARMCGWYFDTKQKNIYNKRKIRFSTVDTDLEEEEEEAPPKKKQGDCITHAHDVYTVPTGELFCRTCRDFVFAHRSIAIQLLDAVNSH